MAAFALFIGRWTSGFLRDELDNLTRAVQIIGDLRKQNRADEVCIAHDASEAPFSVRKMFRDNPKIMTAIQKCAPSVGSCCTLYREGTVLLVLRHGDDVRCEAPFNAQAKLGPQEVACRPMSKLGELLDLVQ